MAEFDPPKWNMLECWRYATRGGLTEEDGDPSERFMEGDRYLLVEKKAGPDSPTYWGTLYRDTDDLWAYTDVNVTNGWQVVYMFDLNSGKPMPTALAFRDTAANPA